ncbi:MAG: fatty acid CoA ligase family protein [Desulfobacterales bacterium]
MTDAPPLADAACVNIASTLAEAARRTPYRPAVVAVDGRAPGGRLRYVHLTFGALAESSDRLAWGLKEIGVERGMRTILLVRPGLEFFELLFALFKVGAVPVIVDPGMGLQRMLACYRSTRPQAMIGIPRAHAFRILFRKHFREIRIRVTVGRRWFWGGQTLRSLSRAGRGPFPAAATAADEPAAILFTTGSTGPVKGAVYTHGGFAAQLRAVGRELAFGPEEKDLSTFPLFALFYPALGVTAVIPPIDPTRPAKADPALLVEVMENQGVTNLFASPVLLERLSRFCSDRGLGLAFLKRVISAGAPVPPAAVAGVRPLLAPSAEVLTPYGATEAVPVAVIRDAEILHETRALTERGYGICVGTPVEGIELRVLRIRDEPIPRWDEALVLPPGEIGEIVVRGAHVSPGYFENPQADALHKIADGEGGYWHRMGDVGWIDRKGRLWFCGRKSHRVVTSTGTLFTVPCEGIFNTHPLVRRSALVGVGPSGHQVPVLCVELHKTTRRVRRKIVREELLDLARRHEMTRPIRTVLFHRAFPVDIRHNAKIQREDLAAWAARRLKMKSARRRGRKATLP